MNAARSKVDSDLARRRRACGMTQQDVATALGVSRTKVSKWERGQRLKPHEFDALTELFDADKREGLEAGARRLAVSELMQEVADRLIGQAETEIGDDGEIGRGWRRDLNTDQRLSAWATAYGLEAVALTGTRHLRLDLSQVRTLLRRLELPSGGWTSLAPTQPDRRRARPEVTSVVLAALIDADESRDVITAGINRLVDLLKEMLRDPRPLRSYVLASSLIDMSRFELDQAIARPFLDALVRLSVIDHGRHAWPEVAGGPASTLHTAAAVCALVAWERRIHEALLTDRAISGRKWLEQKAVLGIGGESFVDVDTDGQEQVAPRMVHFTSAWVLRAIVEARGSPSGIVARNAYDKTLSPYRYLLRGWQLPDSETEPVWMTYQGMVALRSWALSRTVDVIP
jgi:transcriptional regulator with XRE-family HTH domain